MSMKTKSELLQDFLNKFPNSSHPLDERRFVKYAVSCAKEKSSIDTDAMIKAKVDEKRIHQLEIAYDWIRDAFDYMTEEGMICSVEE